MSPDARTGAAEGRWFAVGAALLALTLVWTVRGFIPDAAWFTVHQAENLANGLGFVWNAGGAPVEAFLSPLLLIVEALAAALGLSPIMSARWVGVGCELGTLCLVWRQGTRIFGSFAAGVGAWVLAATPAFALWAVSGMETAPLALVVTALLLGAMQPAGDSPWRAGVLLALVPWLRPEGPLLAIVLAAIVSAAGERVRARIVPIVVPLAASILVLLGLRWAIFGHAVPTAVLFVFGSTSAGVTMQDTLERLAPLLPFLALGAVPGGRRGAVLGVGSLGILALSLVWMDHLTEYGRHILLVWPILCLLAGVGVATLVQAFPGARGRAAASVAGLALGAAVLATPLTTARSIGAFAERYRDCKQAVREEAAAWMRGVVAPGEVVAIADVGLFGAQLGRDTLDLFGFADPRFYDTSRRPLAERAAALLDAPPRWLLLRSETARGRLDPRYSIDAEIAKKAAFDKTYMHLYTVELRDCDHYLWVYWNP